MRQLEQALLLLADRAEPLSPEILLERIETQLEAEGTRPVAAHGEEPTMTIHHPPEVEPTVEPQPQRRRRAPLIAAATAVAVVVAGFGIAVATGLFDGDESDDFAAPSESVTSTSTTEVTHPPPPPTPAELADQLWAAHSGSDPSAWLAMFPTDHGIFNELGWDFLEDYDGDGLSTMADWQQFHIALHASMEFTREWNCETVSEDTARCTVSWSDAFYELGGAAPPTRVYLDTFAAGLLTAEETVEPAEPEQWDAQFGVAEGGRDRALNDYQDWVFATYPERYPNVFDNPIEEEMVDFVVLPAAVAEHQELIAEYLQAVRES